MSHSFDGNHRIDSRSTGKTGAVHYEKIADFPCFAVGVGSGSFGRTAQAGSPHDVEGKKREPARIPARSIHRLSESVDRAAAARFVSAPFCVRRENMAGASCLKDACCRDESLSQVAAVEWGKRIVCDRMALRIGGYTAALFIA